MNLFVDIGNSRIKWRMLDEALLIVSEGIIDNEDLSSEYLFFSFGYVCLSHIFISNVSNDSLEAPFRLIASNKKAKMTVVSTQEDVFGVKIEYENINSFGVDRWLALLGAFDKAGVLVIDAGSAITADYIDDNGMYVGGYIIPGLSMSRNLLINQTARVGVLADVGEGKPGLSTNQCVNNGVVIMFRSLLSGLIDIAESKGINRFVITGGDGLLFQEWGDHRLQYVENLVLDGLLKCFKNNRACLAGSG